MYEKIFTDQIKFLIVGAVYMIPKILHYCWFGGKPLPESVCRYIDSWRLHCPDYKIIEWNEKTFDTTQNFFVREAYEQKKWAFVADYARLEILYKYGGIYLDSDIEIIKGIDDFLKYRAFIGFEAEKRIQTGVIGACPANEWIKVLLDYYNNKHFLLPNGDLDTTTNVKIITDLTYKLYNIQLNNRLQLFGNNMRLFPVEYFCAKSYETGKVLKTNKTYMVHHFIGSWLNEKQVMQRERRRSLNITYGTKIGNIISSVLDTYEDGGVQCVIKKSIKRIMN